ncbi:hypothetical protein R3P38DRAFT_2772023 [Favolaschia claudopus]|uniref:Uncharacterized protein n=1 Tax=Favolaschia claudopus TaxID=2862362 RepID=A0AAW0C8W2_9AGAR
MIPLRVGYYNSEGQLQGWVREEKSQKTRRTSHSQHKQTSSLPAPTPITAPAERNVASTPANPTTSPPLPLSSASAPAPLSLEEASSLSYWNGFPDGRLRCHFTAQQLEDTSQLAVYWVGNRLSGKRGSPTAATPEKGKVSHFQGGAVFECNHTHSHARYTHLLLTPKSKPPQLQSFVSRRPVSLISAQTSEPFDAERAESPVNSVGQVTECEQALQDTPKSKPKPELLKVVATQNEVTNSDHGPRREPSPQNRLPDSDDERMMDPDAN